MDGLRVIVVAVLISKRVLEWRAGDVLGQLLVLRRGTVMISGYFQQRGKFVFLGIFLLSFLCVTVDFCREKSRGKRAGTRDQL